MSKVDDCMVVLTGEDSRDVDSLIKAVVSHGSDQWFGLGLSLGLEYALIVSVAGDKPTCTDKLRALIEEKRQQVGNEKLREELLKACQEIPKTNC